MVTFRRRAWRPFGDAHGDLTATSFIIKNKYFFKNLNEMEKYFLKYKNAVFFVKIFVKMVLEWKLQFSELNA